MNHNEYRVWECVVGTGAARESLAALAQTCRDLRRVVSSSREVQRQVAQYLRDLVARTPAVGPVYPLMSVSDPWPFAEDVNAHLQGLVLTTTVHRVFFAEDDPYEEDEQVLLEHESHVVVVPRMTHLATQEAVEKLWRYFKALEWTERFLWKWWLIWKDRRGAGHPDEPIDRFFNGVADLTFAAWLKSEVLEYSWGETDSDTDADESDERTWTYVSRAELPLRGFRVSRPVVVVLMQCVDACDQIVFDLLVT